MRIQGNRTLSFLKSRKHYLGIGLTAVSFFFIFQFINGEEVSWTIFSKISITEVLILSFFLTFPVYSTAEASRLIFLANGNTISYSHSFQALGLSQIAKYIPGNIANLIGRSMYLLNFGLEKKAIMWSLFWEHILLVSSAGLCSVYVIFYLLQGVSHRGWITLLFIVLFVIAVYLFKKTKINIGKYWIFGKAFFWMLFNQVILGAVFLWLLSIHGVAWSDRWLFWISSIIFSWLVGFLVPGSPGGIGVREGVLLFLLSGSLIPDILFKVIFLQRILSIFADVINFLISYIVHKAES